MNDPTLAQVQGYTSHIVDTALSPDHTIADCDRNTVYIGWQCGFEPLFVAVISCYVYCSTLREHVDNDEAIDIARNYLLERGWFTDPSADNDPDHVLRFRS